MINFLHPIHIHEERTAEQSKQLNHILENHPAYEAAKLIASQFLGARKFGDTQALFGFWVPGLVDGNLRGKAGQIQLALFTPIETLNFRSLKKGKPVSLPFQYDEVQLAAVGDYMIGVVEGLQIGTQTQAGTFYWLRYSEADQHYIMRDPMVASAPFGIYAPAELFDVAGMLANRRDMDYFKTWYQTIYPDGSYRAKDIGVHLEIHTETATAEGTFEALTARYQAIGAKIQANMDAGAADIYQGLTPADLNFIAFDSIELTPEVPPAEREAVRHESGEFFQVLAHQNGQATVQLKRPDISNWGYDTPVLGSAAVNPSILASLRPNEFLEFIETIHTLPGRPIQLCIDSVLGHCDFQGAFLLETFDQAPGERANPKYIHSKYLRGPNMYGRDIDFSEPNVKAILLELLIRKVNYGFDCVRVDGAQDFIIEMDEETGLRIQDDEFLNEMSNITQNINGLVRRLDMNLEDGRPWPDDLNWVYNSKYLDHTIERTLPFGNRVKQWSPIIFAHNVHAKFKWFMNKWDRFVEVYRYGENWITGHSNHDNARYFYRMTKMQPSSLFREGDSFDDYYNDQLGETMKAA
ncbi:MAG: glucosylglycerol hydrolase, partial [Anaerolineales bacterium]